MASRETRAVSLRAQVAQAQAHVEAVNQRGRGRKRFAERDERRQAATAIVQRHLRILEILGFSSEVYTSVEAIAVEPP
jgi:hypothetical protein